MNRFSVAVLFVILTNFAKSQVSFEVNPISGCAPLEVQFNYTGTALGASVFYWDFGNDEFSCCDEANPLFTYTTSGTKIITLYVFNSNFEPLGESTQTITIDGSNAFVSTTNSIVGNSINFGITGTVSNIIWNFGDETTSTDQNTNHTYNEIGTYNVTVSFESSCGMTQNNFVINIIETEFFVSPISGCAPLEVTASYLGGLSPAYYYWIYGNEFEDFGTEPNSTYIFNNSGNSSVELYLFDEEFEIIGFFNQVVQIQGGSIFASTNSTSIGQNVSFYSSGNFNSILWNFGDGTTSTNNNPNHSYSELGNYAVTAIVQSNSCGEQILTLNINVTDVGFTINPNSGCSPLISTLTYTGTDPNVEYFYWFFADGTEEFTTEPTISYTFDQVGANYVYLYLFDFDFNFLGEAFNVANISGVSAYASTESTGVGNNVSFYLDGSYTSVLWDFGDGNTSTSPFSVHAYSNVGSYAVTATIQSEECGQTISTIYININDINFTVTPASGCAPFNTTMSFSGSSTNAVYFYWFFSDGSPEIWGTESTINHVFSQTGENYVYLYIFNEEFDYLGDAMQMVFVDGNQIFSSVNNVSTGTNIEFFLSGNASSILWDFGDGTTSTETNPTHSYTEFGTYTVTATVNSPACGTQTLTLSINIVDVNFSYTTNGNCAPVAINFNYTGTLQGTYYYWDFGDGNGTCCDFISPSHNYFMNGNYQVNLYVYNDFFELIGTKTVDIQIGAVAFISTEYSNVNEIVEFGVSGDVISVNWNLGDGTSSTDLNFTHFYTSSGTYNIQANVITQNCGTLVYNFQINVTDLSFSSSVTSGCSPLNVSFQYTGNQSNVTYVYWDFGNGQTSCCDILNPSAFYSNPGVYDVSMYAYDFNWEFIGFTQQQISILVGITPTNPNINITSNCNITITDIPTAVDCFGEIIQGTTTNSLTYNNPGVYQVFWTYSANGISINQIQTITVTNEIDNSVSIGSNSLIANNSNATYQWVNCNSNFSQILGQTNQSFPILENGSYAVILTSNGCYDTSQCINISNVGLEELVVENYLEVYPNPNNGSFTVKSIKSGNFSIVNQLGQTVYTFTIEPKLKNEIQVVGLSKGIYYIQDYQRINLNKKIVVLE
jgi:PKD repeat protein